MTIINYETQVMVITGTYGNGDTIADGTSYELSTLTLTEDGTGLNLNEFEFNASDVTWAVDGVDLGAFTISGFTTTITVGGQSTFVFAFSFAGATYIFPRFDLYELGPDLHAQSEIEFGGSLTTFYGVHSYNFSMPQEDALRFTGQAWHEHYNDMGVFVRGGLIDVIVYDPDSETSFASETYEQQIRSSEFPRNFVDVWGTVTVTHIGGVIADVAVMRTIEEDALGAHYHYFFESADLAAGGITVADVIGITNFVIGADDVAKWTDLGLTQHARDFQGTEHTDDIVATDLDDTFYGNNGDDTLFGRNGADIAFGGKGADTLHGEDGADVLYGDGGQDSLYGDGAGDDIFGGGGADRIEGGAGEDTLTGGNGDDLIKGENGDDTLYGGDGSDLLSGGDGFDDLFGGAGIDTLRGEDGDDTLTGGGAGDILDAGTGNDTVYGGSGDDSIYGAGQEDYIDAGSGVDFVLGGLGADEIIGGTEGDTLYGEGGADILRGGRGADTLYGGTQSDDLNGQKGADVLDGGGGLDTLEGAEGDDILTGGGGADIFVFADATNLGDDTLTDWQDGADILQIAGAVFADLTITYTTDTLIAWNGNTLTLTGITTGIDASDFDFV